MLCTYVDSFTVASRTPFWLICTLVVSSEASHLSVMELALMFVPATFEITGSFSVVAASLTCAVFIFPEVSTVSIPMVCSAPLVSPVAF